MDGLTTEDRAVLDRLFGPELPADFLPECESAKGVEWAEDADASAAIGCLLLNIVHEGLGGGQCMGWGLTREPGALRYSLNVYRLKLVAEAA